MWDVKSVRSVTVVQTIAGFTLTMWDVKHKFNH